jgi:DnaK suppressor protein
MNATVTASARKSAAKKPAETAKSKPAGKSTGAQKMANPLKSASEAIKPATKTAAGTAGRVSAGTKATSKPAAKSAIAEKTTPAAPAKTLAGKKTAVAPERSAGTGANPVSSEATGTGVAGVAERNQSGVPMSSNKESAGLADKIGKPVVSKVSEVATKSSKPTPTDTPDGALLTEAEILNMSDKDYMNEAQLAFFRARLQQLERDLLKNAGETTEHLRETVLVPDPADRATIEEEHALELRTRDRERKLLKKVQQSIAAIDSGEYGWCEETGEPIGIPRLLARPTATLSLEAQQRRELKQKLYGD